MTLRSEPSRGDYDVVVIGSGLGGLSAAALLAHAGLAVLVAEQGEGVGGYAHSFRRGSYVLDPAIHQVPGGPYLDAVFDYLDVSDCVTLRPVDPLYTVAFPDLRVDVTGGDPDAFYESHARAFPAEAESITRFRAMLSDLSRQADAMPFRLSLRELDAAQARAPLVFRYRRASVADVIDEYFVDDALKATLTATWVYQGVPPSRMPFLDFSRLLEAIARAGFVQCEGGFQRVADAFAAAVERAGGEVVVGREVVKIVLADGAVAGIELAGGEVVRSPVVVSNADALVTFLRLVGSEHLDSRFARRLARMRPGLSAVLVFAATTLDVAAAGASHETFVFPHTDHDRAFDDVLQGRPTAVSVSIATLHDPSLGPAGEHVFKLTTFAPWDLGEPWDQARERYADAMLGLAERALPGLRETLTFVETSTPPVLERYTRSTAGSAFGWELAFDQRGLAHRTPIEGLYLAGQWTEEGPGGLRTIMSGINTARLVLEPTGRAAAVPEFAM